MPMSNAEAARRLRLHHTNLSLEGGSTAIIDALSVALAALEDRQNYDWLSADHHREQLQRMSRQLEALAPLMQNLADQLDNMVHIAPKGYQRDAVTTAKQTIDDAFDSILHPSFYRRYL